MRISLLVGIGALIVAGCQPGTDGAASTSSNAGGETTVLTDTTEMDPTVPSARSLEVNQELLIVPDGHVDCGQTILTSGWPTTTVFNPETSLTCLYDAIGSDSPSQYAHWGRDGNGGVVGSIIRISGAGAFTFIEYMIDRDGVVSQSEYQCAALESDIGVPPICADG